MSRNQYTKDNPKLIDRIKARTKYVGECFIYLGCPSVKDNNGKINVMEDGVVYSLGQFAFFHANGHLNRNKIICHTCDNNRCWNPKHVYEGNDALNSRDRAARGRNVAHFGSAHYNTELNENLVKEIKLRLSTTKYTWGLYSRIAKEFNTTRKVIQHIAVGDSWKHVKV